MRRWIVLGIVALAAWAGWPRGFAPGISVVGDGAPDVLARLDLPEGASVDAVLLRREGSLRHLPDLARLCRGRCGAGVTRLRVPGARDRLLIEMSGLDGIVALDRGEGLPDALAGCVARVVAAESTGAAEGCAGSRRVVWALPYGL